MPTVFPSQHSRDIYATLKGRPGVDPMLPQSKEDLALLASRKGKFAMWLRTTPGNISVAAYSFAAAGVGVSSFIPLASMSDGIELWEPLTAAACAVTPFVVAGSLHKFVDMEKSVRDAQPQPRNLKNELFESLTTDLAGIGYTVLDASTEEMTFNTQHGVVVVGEDKHEDLTLLLNGAPLRASYEEIAATPREFITSFTGKKVPVSAPQIAT